MPGCSSIILLFEQYLEPPHSPSRPRSHHVNPKILEILKLIGKNKKESGSSILCKIT
jgi:hypothetical protein